MRASSSGIRCSVCGKGKLVRRIIEHDVGDLLDMKHVVVSNLPALVCTKCGSVSMYGGILEQIALQLGALILRLPDLYPFEVRYLRKLVGDTQEELAQRLGVARITVHRWEKGEAPTTGPDAYAIRSHAFFRLRGLSQAIEAAASAFIETKPQARKRVQRYRIEGASLQRAS
jgi:YgiT-type zinc finger domain-containing protein